MKMPEIFLSLEEALHVEEVNIFSKSPWRKIWKSLEFF